MQKQKVRNNMKRLLFFVFAFGLLGCDNEQESSKEVYDIIINNARVIDPETGFDAIMNIGVSGDKISTITNDEISGKVEIEATGLIAAPGFIDLHVHGQDPYTEKLGVRDGRTTQLELESGAWPIQDFYNYKKGNSLSNYGASVGHLYTRIQAMDDVNSKGSGALNDTLEKTTETGNKWLMNLATDEELDKIDAYLIQGLKDGGIGIGIMPGHYNEASSKGLARAVKVAKANNSFITTHTRYINLTAPSGTLGIQEMIALSTSYNVPLLIHHVPTNALSDTPIVLDMIDSAKKNGTNIVGEAFPYVKGSTFIGTRILDEGWQERMDMDYDDLQWVETGETLTKESFEKYRRERPEGWYLMEHIKEKDMKMALLHPDVHIGSDAMPFVDKDGELLPRTAPFGEGLGHPRGAGAHSTYLRMAIDDGSLTFPQILAKTSYLQAKFIEDSAPSMKNRGRLQEDKFADITIFDPKTVDGVAGYEPGTSSLPSKGIIYVIVNGQLVVNQNEIVEDTFPGSGIRGEIK